MLHAGAERKLFYSPVAVAGIGGTDQKHFRRIARSKLLNSKLL
jgi:hypothetical protein